MRKPAGTLALLLTLVDPCSAAAIAQERLADVVVPIRSIEFTSDDEDLRLLADVIGDARIVVLGEATHSDGAVSRAKARVARYLHEQMGFDVLAWETGFLQAHTMNAALRDDAVPLDDAAAYLMSGGWAWDADIRPLLAHARDSWRSDRPLRMAGFDTGRPRRSAPEFMRRIDQLFERVPSARPAPASYALVAALAQRGFGFLSSEPTPEGERRAQLAALDTLERSLRENEALATFLSPRELAFTWRMLEHLRVSERLKEARGVERAWARDREMARLLRWLAEEMYPDRRIIVWAATAHFVRSSDRIVNPSDSTMYRVPYEAGNHLAAWLGDDLVTIGFTSHAGELGDRYAPGSSRPSRVQAAAPPSDSTVEALLHRAGYAYALVDVGAAVDAGALPTRFRSIALGRIENAAPWASVLDALFFIDRAEPVRYVH